MLITDLIPRSSRSATASLVEREHLDLIIAEQKLSRSRLVDPATRIPSGHLIGHNRAVTGTLTISGATATLTVTVTNTTTGVSARSPTPVRRGAGIFDLEKSVVDDVAKLICDPPARYVGIGVRLDPGVRGRGLGDLRLERHRSASCSITSAPRPAAAPRASTPSSGPRAAPST